MMMNRQTFTQTSLLLFILCRAISGLGSVVSRSYSYYFELLTWEEAGVRCQSEVGYSDLAIFYTQEDVDGLNMEHYDAWIGLRIHGDHWKWSDGQSSSNFGWARHEPNGRGECAFISSNTKAYNTRCDDEYFFMCLDDQKNYQFISERKTWSGARSHCQSEYVDLVSYADDAGRESAAAPRDFPVWTGLYRDGETWQFRRWVSEYRNWTSGQPGASDDCVAISSLGKTMSTQNCSAHFPVLCYTDNLVLVKENKTWEEAQEHCRGVGSNHELVSVQPGSDHLFILNKVMEADTEEVWAGLRFLAGEWLWANGADMLYSDLPVCPSDHQHCGALSKNNTEILETRDCSERRNFLCYMQ